MQFQDGKMATVGGTHSPITENMKAAIDYIFGETVDIDTYDLVQMSHVEEGPWSRAFNPDDSQHGQVISKEDMFLFYQSRAILSV